MKKRLLAAGLLLAATLFGETALAQNYQPFRKGLTYHYSAQDSIFSLRVDSAKVVAGDSVFVFNRTVKKVNPSGTCLSCMYQVQNNNQFGTRMIKKQNGDYIFRSSQGQEFLLKTKTAVNQSWTFNTTANLTATLSSKGLEPVASLSDSVFTYSLSNGAQIKLSKNYGFVTMPNFVNYADASFRPKTLLFYALPEKGIGSAISDPFRIYDFAVGDKFMYYLETFAAMWSGPCTEEWKQFEVLSKRFSMNGDTLYYSLKVDRLHKGHGSPSAPSGMCQSPTATTVYPSATTSLIVTRQSPAHLRTLSNGFYINSANYYQSMISRGISKNNQFNSRPQHHFEFYNYDSNSQNFLVRVDNGRGIGYGVGLGKTYDQSMYATETLIAYVKGTETYGRWQSIPQLLGTKEDLQVKPLVKAYPNPFASELNLTFGEITGNVQLSLMNALGQQVWVKEMAASANSEMNVTLPELAKGLYILKASQNGKTYTTRLVKE